LNICLLSNRDLASNFALNLLLPMLAEEQQTRVFLSSKVGGKQALPAELAQLAFFEQTLFNNLMFPALDSGSPEGSLLSFQQLSRYTCLPISTLNRINSDESLAILGESAPDLILSIRYGGILREAAIALPRLGVINLHSGLLPDYRGVMASFRAMLNGEREIGTTLHYISDPGIDTGDIIDTTGLAVEPAHSYLWHVLQLYPQACDRLFACVQQLDAGQTLAVSPQPAGGSYYSFPDEDDLQAFHKRGLRLYDVGEITAFAKQYLGANL
jgi:methionyl-tRNA formyltransferase